MKNLVLFLLFLIILACGFTAGVYCEQSVYCQADTLDSTEKQIDDAIYVLGYARWTHQRIVEDSELLSALQRYTFGADIEDHIWWVKEYTEIIELLEGLKLTSRVEPGEISQINQHLSTHLLETLTGLKKTSEEREEQLVRRIRELESKLHELETRAIW